MNLGSNVPEFLERVQIVRRMLQVVGADAGCTVSHVGGPHQEFRSTVTLYPLDSGWMTDHSVAVCMAAFNRDMNSMIVSVANTNATAGQKVVLVSTVDELFHAVAEVMLDGTVDR